MKNANKIFRPSLESADAVPGPSLAPYPFSQDRKTRSSPLRQRLANFIYFLKFCDFCSLLIAGVLGYILQFGTWSMRPPSADFFVLVISLIAISSMHLARSYQLENIFSVFEHFRRLLFGAVATVTCMFFIAHFSGSLEHYSREWASMSILLGAALLLLNRIGIAAFLHVSTSASELKESIVIIGANEQAEKMLSRIVAAKFSHVKVLGVFDDRVHRPMPASVRECLLGSTDIFLEYARKNQIDRVVVALPWSRSDRITEILNKCRTVPSRIDLLPDDMVWGFPSINMERLDGVPIVTVANSRVVDQGGLLKRTEDIVLSFILLTMSMPLMAVIALAIKIDSNGPVFFKQKRYGFNNKIIEVYKFRSMAVCNSTVPVVQAIRGDPRITRVGKILRRLSLDELPQLLNVIKGNMSIVGPRPLAIIHNEEYGAAISEYFARHNVKPGITGWAQVNGLRGEIKDPVQMRRRLEHDLSYIENWSLFLDIRIVLMTAVVVWFQKTAY